MVDISKIFHDSFKLLFHDKKIIIPSLISILIPLLFFFIFINVTGISPVVKEYTIAYLDFEDQKVNYLTDTDNIGSEDYTSELVNFLGRESSSSTFNDDYEAYLEEIDFDHQPTLDLLTLENLLIFIIFFIIGLILYFYFSTMSFAVITLAIHKKKINANNLLSVTHKFLWKYLSLSIIQIFIIIAPLILMGIFTTLLIFLNEIVGAISILLFIVLFFIYLFIISVRLFFTSPALFIEKTNALQAIKNSLKLTKGHFKQALIIFFVIMGIGFFINAFVGKPLNTSYGSLIIGVSLVKITINFILLLLFLTLEAFVFTFQSIFLFYSYIEFKEKRSKDSTKSKSL